MTQAQIAATAQAAAQEADLGRLVRRGYANVDQLDEDGLFRFGLYLGGMLTEYDNAYYQYRVGLLDERFGLGYFEDDDYCRRVEAAGHRIACAEDVFVHHRMGASFSQLDAERKHDLVERNRRLYEEKWGTWKPHEYR